MRGMILVVAVTLGLAGRATAVEDQVYRWTDRGGRLHFSNVPAPGAEPTGIISDEELPVAPQTPEGGVPEGSPPTAPPQQQSDGDAVDDPESGHAALERQQVERQIRDADRQLRALQGHLDDLAAARTRYARGSQMAGGLGTNAGAFQSDEEKVLSQERDTLRARIDKLRAGRDKPREQVTSLP